LIDMAFPGSADLKTGKLAVALLGSIDERLEPLRPVMRMDPSTSREGLFSWKGFLYYKWSLSDITPKLATVIKEIPCSCVRDGAPTINLQIEEARSRIIKGIKQRNAVSRRRAQSL